MKIAVIGAGNIGGTLGKKWASAGHEVGFGVRNPADAKFDALRSVGKIVSVADALQNVEVVLLSMSGGAVAEFAEQFGARLNGKIVIDATNNVRSPEMNNLALLKEKAPQALLVRAFSSLGWENFAQPTINGETIDLFYCGAKDARNISDQLVQEIGVHPVYLGDLDAAPIIDHLTRLWFITLVSPK